jgi:glycosyltransferase involved in cell wall biosynthesis
VTFRVGGVEEVVVDGITGVVLDLHDTALMVKRVAALLDDRATRDGMSAAARARAPMFSAIAVAERYADQLSDLVRDRRRSRRTTSLS